MLSTTSINYQAQQQQYLFCDQLSVIGKTIITYQGPWQNMMHTTNNAKYHINCQRMYNENGIYFFQYHIELRNTFRIERYICTSTATI